MLRALSIPTVNFDFWVPGDSLGMLTVTSARVSASKPGTLVFAIVK
jgi:hypothetical protein